MPDLSTLLTALGDASGWVVAMALAILGLYALATGLIVPGYVYRREVARGDRAEDAIEASTRTTEQAATATKSATDTALVVASQLSQLQAAIRDTRRESDR